MSTVGSNEHKVNCSVNYIGHYPVAAFIVHDKATLGPLVTRLRALGRLKPGRNVTPFYPDYVHLVHSIGDVQVTTEQHEVQQASQLTVYDVSLHAEDDDDKGRDGHEVPCLDSARMYMPSNTDTVEQQRASLLQRMRGTGSSSPPLTSYMAVHVTGQWTADELSAVLCTSHETPGADLSGNSTKTPPLCFITPLRVYDRACCALVDLPHELVLLRHLSRTTKHPSSSSLLVQFTFAELFAGIGMFRRGLERIGGRAVFAVECAAEVQRVYKANYPATSLTKHDTSTKEVLQSTFDSSVCPLVGDVTEIPTSFFAGHDLLTAGFPCQSFAKASATNGLGLKHSKGWLFYEVVRVLRGAQPRAFLLENVAHLTCLEQGAQLREILRCLRHPHKVCYNSNKVNGTCSSQCLSYAVQYRVIDGALASPQTRQRVYFMGIRTDILRSTSRGEAILSAVFDRAITTLQDAQEQLASHMPRFRSVRDVLLENAAPPLRVHRDAATTQAAKCETLVQETQDAERVRQTLLQARLTAVQWEAVRRSRSFRHNPQWRIVRLDECARTLLGSYRSSYQLYSEFVPLPSTRSVDDIIAKCISEVHNDNLRHDDEHCPPLRFYTPRECARLQGIDDDFDLLLHDEHDCKSTKLQTPYHTGEAYRLVGNAVNPLIIAALGQALMEQVRSL